jgi:hypothetical protein
MEYAIGDKVQLNPDLNINKTGATVKRLVELGVTFLVIEGNYVEDGNEYIQVEWYEDAVRRTRAFYARRFAPINREIKEGIFVTCIDPRRSSVLVKGGLYRVLKIEEKDGKKLVRVAMRARHIRYSFPLEMFEYKTSVVPKDWVQVDDDWKEEFLNKLAAGEHRGLCSFAIMLENGNVHWYKEAPCHAAFQGYGLGQKPVKAIGLCFSRHYRGFNDEKKKEGYKRFINWLVNESSLKDCFLPRNTDLMMENGVLMNVEKTVSQIAVAAIAARHYHEFSEKAEVFDEVMDLGFDGNVAMFVSTFFNKRPDGSMAYNSWGGGHHFLSHTMDTEELFKFFKEGFIQKNIEHEMPVNKGGLTGYTVLHSVAKETRGANSVTHYVNKLKGMSSTAAGAFGAKVAGFSGKNAIVRLCAAVCKDI